MGIRKVARMSCFRMRVKNLNSDNRDTGPPGNTKNLNSDNRESGDRKHKKSK